MGQPRVEIGSGTCSRDIPQTFDLVLLHRTTIPLRLFCTAPAVQSTAFERVEDADCVGISKVELDDIDGIKWCAREWPQDVYGRVGRRW